MSRHIPDWWSPENFFLIFRNFFNVKRIWRQGAMHTVVVSIEELESFWEVLQYHLLPLRSLQTISNLYLAKNPFINFSSSALYHTMRRLTIQQKTITVEERISNREKSWASLDPRSHRARDRDLTPSSSFWSLSCRAMNPPRKYAKMCRMQKWEK